MWFVVWHYTPSNGCQFRERGARLTLALACCRNQHLFIRRITASPHPPYGPRSACKRQGLRVRIHRRAAEDQGRDWVDGRADCSSLGSLVRGSV